ncbi:peptidylprolyl isomerase [Sphingomonas sp. Root710]|uniref:FKBP-type peptidyl-prolyl cis-trans isomerase n=1 Tax=Sphingomonas sp. Root710 TaxID=1736594 RepID=UPI0006F3B786|nr:FKBP-type peptidyl-prolyl cis-trans isomerase [Sphingomonas sp. Root710]KRB82516.1 peptidylprolyl isomerase [Sphingomonas sp. Root710]
MSEVTAVPLRPIAKGSLVKLWVGVAAAIAIGLGAAYLGTAGQVAMAMSPDEFLAANAKDGGVVQTPSGLQYKVLREGNGPKPGPADIVLVNYDGKLLSGETFDSTKTDGKPRAMPIGGTIPGWTEGLQLMSKGSKYRFWMPPALAYGEHGAGNGVIPPNAVITFDVELLEIAPAPMGGMPGGHGGM